MKMHSQKYYLFIARDRQNLQVSPLAILLNVHLDMQFLSYSFYYLQTRCVVKWVSAPLVKIKRTLEGAQPLFMDHVRIEKFLTM